LVPETPAFYAARRPEGALEKINKSLRALQQPPIDALPEIEPGAPKPKVTEILSNPRLRPVTLLLAFGYLFHPLTFYYILKFAPTTVAGAGFTQPEAASSLTYANIGGAIGGFLFGFLLKKWDIKGPTIVVAVLGSLAVAAFGVGSDTLWGWRLAAFLTMVFLHAAIVGYHAAFRPSPARPARASCSALAAPARRARRSSPGSCSPPWAMTTCSSSRLSCRSVPLSAPG